MAGIAIALRRLAPARGYSVVFDRFDPVVIFAAQPGISVQGVTGSGTFNMRVRGAFREWRGFVKTSDGRPIPPMIQQAIENRLQKQCQGRFSLVTGSLADHAVEQSHPANVASHGLFLFNEADRHGEMHVWLFPDSSGSGLGYVIALVEEPLD